MSLTVSPASAISYIDDHPSPPHPISGIGAPFVYVYTSQNFVSDQGLALQKVIEGDIVTTNVPFPATDYLRKQHNCTHVQISGSITDNRYLASTPVGTWIGLNSFVYFEGWCQDAPQLYLACMSISGSSLLRTAKAYAYVAPGPVLKCIISYIRWRFSDGLWYQDMLTERSYAATTADFLNLIPHIREILESDFQPTYTGWQKSAPTVSSVSSKTYDDVARQYQFDSFDWLTAVSELSEVPFGISVPRLQEQHYYAVKKIPVLNENGFQFSRDIVNFLKDCKELYSTVRSATLQPKALANILLSLKYGPPQTLQDLRSVFKQAERSLVTVSGVSATDSIGSTLGVITFLTTIRYHARTGLSAFENVGKLLRYLDADLTPSNIWELIPYSFVVDWFMGIDQSISRQEVKASLEYYDIDAVFDTVAYDGSITAQTLNPVFSGSVNFRRYERICSADAYFPLVAPKEPSPVSHWLEGLALIIQRLF